MEVHLGPREGTASSVPRAIISLAGSPGKEGVLGPPDLCNLEEAGKGKRSLGSGSQQSDWLQKIQVRKWWRDTWTQTGVTVTSERRFSRIIENGARRHWVERFCSS